MRAYDWSDAVEGERLPDRRHPMVDTVLNELPEGTSVTAARYNNARDRALARLQRSNDPQEQEIAQAMQHIRAMRLRFSTDTVGEAFRRLGGTKAVEAWREATKPQPNVVVNVSVDKEAMQRSISSMMKTLGAAAAETYRETVRDVPQAGCMCDYCVDARGHDLMHDTQVDVIVRNLKTCSPASVIAALKILAGAGTKRCAFCGAPEGSVHPSGCPFSSAAGAPYINFVPLPGAPTKPPATTITRDSRNPGMGFGTVTQPNGKPIGAPKQISSAAPKDSILNPPVNGFIGSDKYGYDPDVD